MSYKMAQPPGTLALAIYHTEMTLAVGVYDTNAEAEDALLSYIIVERPELYKKIKKAIYKEYRIKVTGRESFKRLIMSPHHLDPDFDPDAEYLGVYEFLAENDLLAFTVDFVIPGRLYDFRLFIKWSNNNLYDLLDSVLYNRTGALL